jgi:hypothetical protein
MKLRSRPLLIALLLIQIAAGTLACRQQAAPVPEESAVPADAEVPAPPSWPLTCLIQVPTTAKLGQPIELTFTLVNGGERPLWVLPWQTPLEGLISSPFSIEAGGQPVFYTGRMVKRAPPRLEDYVEIAAGASASAKVDLASAYRFERQGVHTVTFDSLLFDVADDNAQLPRGFDTLQSFELDCPTVKFEILP